MRLFATLLAGSCLSLLLTACPGGDAGPDASTAGPDAAAVPADAAAAGPDAETTAPADAAAAGPDAAAPGLDASAPGPDAGPVGSPAGAVCTADVECQGKKCIAPVGPPANNYCSRLCDTDADCAFNDGSQWTCMASGTAKVCVETCDGDAPCPNGVCLPWTDHDYCLDLQGTFCSNQADCPADTWCMNVCFGTKDIKPACWAAPNGNKLVGEACNGAAQYYVPCETEADCTPGLVCSSLQCVGETVDTCVGGCLPENVCSGTCLVDADCPADFVCSYGWYFYLVDYGTAADKGDDRAAPAASCLPMKGSRTTCARDADCSGGERCTFYMDSAGKLKSACHVPDPSAAADGAPCRDDSSTLAYEPPRPCGGFCAFHGPGSVCTQLCVDDGDCPTGQRCLDALIDLVDMTPKKLCLAEKACTRDADCAAGEICAPVSTGLAVRPYCTPALGAIPAGQACDKALESPVAVTCANDAACAADGANWKCNLGTHLCTPPADQVCTHGAGIAGNALFPLYESGCLDEGLCTAACATDADCPGNDWICGAISISLQTSLTYDRRDDTFGLARRCQYLPGSRTACSKPADCAASGETCRPYTKLDGTAATACSTKIAGGRPLGAFCDSGMPCESGLCDFNDGDHVTTTGTCAQPCAADADCPAGMSMTCQDYELAFDGKTSIKACRVQGAGGTSG